jgi:hypothetical protein
LICGHQKFQQDIRHSHSVYLDKNEVFSLERGFFLLLAFCDLPGSVMSAWVCGAQPAPNLFGFVVWALIIGVHERLQDVFPPFARFQLQDMVKHPF